MIGKVTINNFKSIESMELPLGRVNVLIGENGCGKSNILEAIGFGGAAAANKLDRGDLAQRGLRLTGPQLVRSGFRKESATKPVMIRFKLSDGDQASFILWNDNSEYGKWNRTETSLDFNKNHLVMTLPTDDKRAEKELQKLLPQLRTLLATIGDVKVDLNVGDIAHAGFDTSVLASFLIYSPQMAPLRALEAESLVEPLGIYGEGLFRLLQHLLQTGKHDEIRRHLQAIDWFDDVEAVETAQTPSNRSIRIRDHYLTEGIAAFDQHSANEGFLFFLFYTTLFLSTDTPKFFGIDNVENALNPKLCMRLMQLIARLAKENDKQVILTTHNPSILDGLDLKDDEQRLFVVSRDIEGRSGVRRIEYREPGPSEQPVRLSEAFMRGYIGGLPTNF